MNGGPRGMPPEFDWLVRLGVPFEFSPDPGPMDGGELLTCSECEFVADSIENMAEHTREAGH